MAPLSRASQAGRRVSVSAIKLSRYRACEPPPPATHPLEPLLGPFDDVAARQRRDEDFLLDLLEFVAMATAQGRFDLVEAALREIDEIGRRVTSVDLEGLCDSLRLEVSADSPHQERMLTLLNGARKNLVRGRMESASGARRLETIKEIGA